MQHKFYVRFLLHVYLHPLFRINNNSANPKEAIIEKLQISPDNSFRKILLFSSDILYLTEFDDFFPI